MEKNNTLPYDKTNPTSIESYAKELIGSTFRETLGTLKLKEGNKGALGHLLEEHYFFYKLNSDSTPDFKEANVELKVTGYIENKSGGKRAKERLVLNMINYLEIHNETFENSSLLKKNSTLLLIFYLYINNINRLEFPIHYVQLFQYPKNDLKIIRDDWNTIVNKIREGKAHEISESDTNYLAACTKGSSSQSIREQPFNDINAKQRAFSLKNSYLTHILNEYIIKGKKTYDDTIIKDIEELKDITFEQYIVNKIDSHKGKSILHLANEFNVTTKPNSKSFASDITKAMLGVKGTHIEEFEKANIKIKTIRILLNGKIEQHMSFPTFKFTEIINEDWESSVLREMFLSTRFLLVVYEFDIYNNLCLNKCLFWNMPDLDLEGEVRIVWERTVDIIREGIKTKTVSTKTYNNLPSSTESKILHVRPHGRDKNDTYPLPQGGEFTKQSFWLNNSYILNQIYKDNK